MPVVHLEHWWIRVWDFSRLQILLLDVRAGAMALICWTRLRLLARVTLASSGLCLLGQAATIYHTPCATPQVRTARPEETEQMQEQIEPVEPRDKL